MRRGKEGGEGRLHSGATMTYLDDIGASRDTAAHSSPHAILAVGRITDARKNSAAEAVLGVDDVRAGRRDALGGDEQARARNNPTVDGVAHPDVGVAQALGAQVAVGGVAGQQPRAAVVGRAQHALHQRLVPHLLR